MRLFIAVDLSEPMKKSLVNVMHEMKKQGINASYIPKQNLHMTLAFIGETNKADEIRQIMDRMGTGTPDHGGKLRSCSKGSSPNSSQNPLRRSPSVRNRWVRHLQSEHPNPLCEGSMPASPASLASSHSSMGSGYETYASTASASQVR